VKLPQELQHVHTRAINSETVKTNFRSVDVQNKPNQTKQKGGNSDTKSFSYERHK